MNKSLRNRIYFWAVVAILLAAILLCGWGCASVHYKTPDAEFRYIGVLKDVQLDPNGLCSTTSPKAESIITGLIGLLFGWWM